ncbi:MAG: hypothetical protein COT85_01545 [Chlamydiae bacterium CG10_big_fil_rev_8_21_14_0_10_42_34]|nr:MAG: hypothetical protein COT85_01545 [Chlamydiae bacterium CG10_big_fil_rev_8_21_14_0_10_42_34]
MKYFTVICLSLFSSHLFALAPYERECEIYKQYTYVTVGGGPLPYPIPTLSGGYRTQNTSYGFDLNAAVVLVAPTRIATKFAGRYLHYFNPNIGPQVYAGIGAAISPIFSWKSSANWAGLGISPELLIGREHFSENGGTRFWEIVIDFPTYSTDEKAYKWGGAWEHVVYFPYVYFQYGWGF